MKLGFSLDPIYGVCFAFFDGDKLVVLMNGFQKKTQKTPKNQIEKALSIMTEYYEQKGRENGN
ncbi:MULTISPECIES: type II toxin-antitoxin system RelE/ParE family toxin [unclassified Sphingobacterium]|uniref:type II toxin-antitoxin system RelE/ParE family toxin n=1 Tax=unclassified Sphingobacterium TaxID=2609468 RepID=UPI0025DD3892|nr:MULTISPECIES: type II toxin-antitoxin system RelE/ParE family toxin [unclassified Sphingobacterium]